MQHLWFAERSPSFFEGLRRAWVTRSTGASGFARMSAVTQIRDRVSQCNSMHGAKRADANHCDHARSRGHGCSARASQRSPIHIRSARPDSRGQVDLTTPNTNYQAPTLLPGRL